MVPLGLLRTDLRFGTLASNGMSTWSILASWLTIVGLILDIIGIWLLYWYGAVGSWWIDDPMPDVMDGPEERYAGPALEVFRNRRKARKGALWGISIVVIGFLLQIVAPGVNLLGL